MKLSEVLTDARALVEDGWIQGRLQNLSGVCMVGALTLATRAYRHKSLEKGRLAAEGAVLAKIVEMFPDEQLSQRSCGEGLPYSDGVPYKIASFNDKPHRTKEEVLSVFDKAILSAQERGD